MRIEEQNVTWSKRNCNAKPWEHKKYCNFLVGWIVSFTFHVNGDSTECIILLVYARVQIHICSSTQANPHYTLVSFSEGWPGEEISYIHVWKFWDRASIQAILRATADRKSGKSRYVPTPTFLFFLTCHNTDKLGQLCAFSRHGRLQFHADISRCRKLQKSSSHSFVTCAYF